jgi:hypothetical protein
MVAYDSRRVPDPSQLLANETIEALRSALIAQRNAGARPIDELARAIHDAAREAKERSLPPEALLIQVKSLADDVGLPMPDADRTARGSVREWIVGVLLRAYWGESNT